MSGFLLDTNCISEVVRVRPEPRVLAWLDAADEATLYLSTLTLGEIRKGIVAMVESKRRAHLESWLETDLRQRFSGRILPIDDAVTDRWGELLGNLKRQGRPMSTVDGLLAATALHYGLTVVSRNVVDFAHANVPVVNPWEP